MRHSALFAIGIMMSCATAMAEEIPITATKYQHTDGVGYQAQLIDVTYKGNGTITISGAVVNRGNCKSWGKLTPAEFAKSIKAQPRVLKFGQKYTHVTDKNCDVLEVTLFTDQGEITMSW